MEIRQRTLLALQQVGGLEQGGGAFLEALQFVEGHALLGQRLAAQRLVGALGGLAQERGRLAAAVQLARGLAGHIGRLLAGGVGVAHVACDALRLHIGGLGIIGFPRGIGIGQHDRGRGGCGGLGGRHATGGRRHGNGKHQNGQNKAHVHGLFPGEKEGAIVAGENPPVRRGFHAKTRQRPVRRTSKSAQRAWLPASLKTWAAVARTTCRPASDLLPVTNTALRAGTATTRSPGTFSA